jgi:uncharacterized membrane protein
MAAADDYIPVAMHSALRAQAYRIWAMTTAVVLVWIGLIVAAPLLASSGASNASSPIYSFFSYICHQIPERSLHLAGFHMAVCSRCFGVYFGLFAATLAYPFLRPIDETEPLPRIWLFLSLVPITIDWLLTIFGIWENTHLSRFLTGMVLGGACAMFIVPALVEIGRNFSYRRSSSAAKKAAL